MKKFTKKYKNERAFFIHPRTGFITYNKLCKRCVHIECKQSYRVKTSRCPDFIKKSDNKKGD